MNQTCYPAQSSIISVTAETPIPIQNLPFGVFRRRGDATAHIGVAIGEQILDLTLLAAKHRLGIDPMHGEHVFATGRLNELMAAGRAVWSATRARVSHLLRTDIAELRDDAELREQALVPMADVTLQLPADIGDYTDFYSSREHATNVGAMLRGPEQALLPNWLHLPVAYHGRASSVVLSGTDVVRPRGQSKPEKVETPVFGPSRSLDFELELAVFVGPGNQLGQPIPLKQAAEHLFGMVLLNDWSARDIQAWEYAPLGPFLAKNFATSISPWVVTLEALEPFRINGPVQNPAPLPYLQTSGRTAFEIHLEVLLQIERLERPVRISASNAKHLYWSISQQSAHHTITGCNLRPGDLLASGTISGPTPDSYGSLLELAWRGSKPLTLPNGEQRSFLQDDDRVTLTGWCQGDSYRVGFGEVTGRILPAFESPASGGR